MNTFNCSEAKGWLVSYWSLTSRPLHRTNNTFSILLHHFLSTSLQITSPKLGHSSGKSTQFHQSRKAQRIVTSAADKCSVISSSTPKISYAVTVTFHSVLPLHGKTCTYNFACGLLATKIQLADMRCSTPMCTESLLMQLAPTSGICSGEEEKRKKRKRKKKPGSNSSFMVYMRAMRCAQYNLVYSSGRRPLSSAVPYHQALLRSGFSCTSLSYA